MGEKQQKGAGKKANIELPTSNFQLPTLNPEKPES
jgi:hypothetical protein